jgi:Flp pilus assembly protein TadG
MIRLYRLLRNKKGGVAVMAATTMVALFGFTAISVDAGYAYMTYNKLQASTEAAALAGAKDIGVGGSPIATANTYSAITGGKNAIPGITATMVSGYPALQCFSGAVSKGLACTTNQTPGTSANGILVQQTATVPLIFSKVIGISSMTMTANATALAGGQALPPLNVAFVLDTTVSMGFSDSACGKTRLACAVQGFQTLLGELWPCKYGQTCNGTDPVDLATVVQFPPVQAAPSNGACGSLTAAEYAGIYGPTNNTTATNSTTLKFSATPAFPTGTAAGSSSLPANWPFPGQVSNLDQPTDIKAGTYLSSKTGTTATMSTTPAGSISKGDNIAVWPPVYQLMPLSGDYRTSDTATSLNTNSNLVKCLNSLKTVANPHGAFNNFTYFADAINIAQQNLVANSRTGARNVIILLSDGDANATSDDMVGQGSSTLAKDECKAAVTAAQNAAANGTWVYAVAYGASTSGCSTDSGTYKNSCYVMSQIANTPGFTPGTFVNDPTKFYSDNANGCASAKHPAASSLNTMFQNIAYSLTAPRLLPQACFAASRPSYC